RTTASAKDDFVANALPRSRIAMPPVNLRLSPTDRAGRGTGFSPAPFPDTGASLPTRTYLIVRSIQPMNKRKASRDSAVGSEKTSADVLSAGKECDPFPVAVTLERR